MGTFNNHQSDRNRFGKCEICLNYIPVEHYFSKGDEIVCYECGTEYIISSKKPIKLSMIDDRYWSSYEYGELYFDD